MFTRSYTSLRRLSASVLTLLLFGGFMGRGAEAQATTPAVTASYATTLTPPAKLGQVFQTALDSFGDLLFVDWANGALYEYPVGGGAVITLLPAGSLGGYANPGIAIGANNDLYLGGNYNNTMGRLPYDPATKSWDGLSTVSAASGHSTTAFCPAGSGTPAAPYGFACGDTPNTSPYYFQPWAITVDANNNVVVTAQNSNNFIFTIPVNGTGISSTASQANNLNLVQSTARAQSIAADKFGNIYFVEENDKSPLPGVLMIPAGSLNVASDASLKRVDPNLSAVRGVTTDSAGNLYISDANLGVFFVPNPSGTPQTSSAVLLTPVPSDGQVSIDQTRNILYVPTNNASGQVIDAVTFNRAELGATPTAAPTATAASVFFGFSSAVTPASFVIEEAGATNPDFVIASGGTCAAGTAYAAQSNCTVNVTLSPHAAGNVSAKLLMLDGSGNILSSITLHGTGSGSTVEVLPGSETTIGSGLKTPSQVAVDAGGNVYVADSGLAAVEMYPKGSGSKTAGTTVGTGLTAPTGVAADGAGDVFIADSGTVTEVPIGTTGLNASGQVALKSGLGANLKLATDGYGRVYIADPDNHRVVRLGSVGGSFSLYSQTETDFGGFNAPSAIAVDQSQNMFIADGSNVYEVTSTGTQTTVLSSLTGVTGLAVDASGSLYVTMAGQTLRIPNVGGTLSQAGQISIATDVAGATSVALDSTGNLYIANGAAGNVDMVGASASYNFGTLTSTTGSASQSFTVLDSGNLPLNITGFAGTADYSETATTCIGGPVAVDATCSVTITFSPGPGDQGTLTGTVLITGDEANSPVGVAGTGVGATLAASKTTMTVTNPTVDSAPVVVTVASSSGTGATPTGQVTLTITGGNLTQPVIVTGTLASGTVTLTPPQLAAGKYTFAVSYGGDRVYGTSTASAAETLAPGALTMVQPSMAQVQKANPAYPYVLAAAAGAQEPYDGSVTQFEYNYQVQVLTTDGAPLIGQPIYDSKGKQVATNYGSVTFQGASTSSCNAIPVASDGTATFATDCLTINTSNSSIPNILTSYTVTPVYSPAGTGSSAGYTNPNYATVTGSPISFTALRNPMVQISASPSSLSVARGSTANATLTLSSVLGYGVAGAGALLNNYSLPVQLACDGLPAYATCSFSYAKPDPSDPQSINVGPAVGTVLSYMGGTAAACTTSQGCLATPATVVMTINTNVATGAVASIRRGASQTTFAAVLGFGLLGFVFGKKRSLRGRLLVMLCLLLSGGIVTGVSGCGSTQLGTNTGTPTPSGTYTVTVTAKQVGSQTIAQTPGIVYGNGNQVSLPFTVNLTIQ